MEHLNQKCFSPQNLSWSYRRLISIQMAWLWFVQVRLAITLVWKVQFQQFKHFYIACNELIHMEHLNQKCFSPQNLSWSYRRLISMQMAWLWFVQVRLAITLVWKVQFQQFKHFYIACNELIHMEHLNQKCFSPQNLSWSYRRLISMQMAWLWFVQVQLAVTLNWKVQFLQIKHFYIACNELIHMEHLNQKCFSPQNLSWSYRILISMQMAWLWFVQVRLAITLVWKVQFLQFKHFYIACNELIHMEHLKQKCFSPQNLSWSYRRLISMQMAWLWFVQVWLAITLVWKVHFLQFKHFYIACNELIHMEHLNQKCFSPQNLSWSYRRLISMQMAWLWFVQVRLAVTGLEGPIPTIQAFFI